MAFFKVYLYYTFPIHCICIVLYYTWQTQEEGEPVTTPVPLLYPIWIILRSSIRRHNDSHHESNHVCPVWHHPQSSRDAWTRLRWSSLSLELRHAADGLCIRFRFPYKTPTRSRDGSWCVWWCFYTLRFSQRICFFGIWIFFPSARIGWSIRRLGCRELCLQSWWHESRSLRLIQRILRLSCRHRCSSSREVLVYSLSSITSILVSS